MSELYQRLSHSKWDCKYHVVFVPKYRRKVMFGEIRQFLGPIFHELARQKECRIVEGHLMPDHVHLVLGPSEDCDIITFVGQFKNLAQRAAWRTGAKGKIWQTSFWDHFLRADEEVEKAVAYVLDNPVRAELVAESSDYPFSGSLVFDL